MKYNEIVNIRELLEWAKWCTFNIQLQTGSWTINDQLNEIFTEVGELNQIFRHNRNKRLIDCKQEVIEEIWDICLSALTMAHVLDLTTEELMTGLQAVIKKLDHRARTDYYKKP